MARITPNEPKVNHPLTADGWRALQQARALACAPGEEIDQATFCRLASAYPLATLRLASTRYISARGRTYKQVLARLADAIENPHVNRGDTYSTALGHIAATAQWLAERGL